jgi:hypothetical protein
MVDDGIVTYNARRNDGDRSGRNSLLLSQPQGVGVMRKLIAAGVLLGLMALPAAAQPGFGGQWQCPGHGTLVLSQNGVQITGTFDGPPDGTWGPNGRKGGKANGIAAGMVATFTLVNNDGTTAGWTVTLAGNGMSFAGTWNWMSMNGTFVCNRA